MSNVLVLHKKMFALANSIALAIDYSQTTSFFPPSQLSTP